MAFINTTFIDEHGINVIVYDLSEEWFRANVSIWGYDAWDKPPGYKPIVSSGKAIEQFVQ